MRVILATNNQHKRQELAAILPDHDVVTPADLGVTFDHEEVGTTFLQNAMGKALSLYHSLPHPPGHQDIVVADDSGLCVDALSGGPGIYSARYGSPDGGKTELDAATRNDLLLDSLTGAADRSAHFVCAMVAIWSPDRLSVAQETWEGAIAPAPSTATGGFGYDPVFFVPALGCTAADLSEEMKNRYSHRGRAARVLASAIQSAASLPDSGNFSR